MFTLLAPLLLIAGFAIAGWGWLASHDAKVREPLQKELNACGDAREAAVDANKNLQTSFQRYQKTVADAAKKLKDAEALKQKALDAELAQLLTKEATLEVEIAKLKAKAAEAPAATKEEACNEADAILDGVRDQRLRINKP